MVCICEFEFYEADSGAIIAVPLSFEGEGTFGDDLEDAVESAADWLMCTVDDALMAGRDMPPTRLDNEPRRGGRVIALAVARELGDIPAMTAADAARALGVTPARVSQLIKAGKLESWRDGTKRMVSRASVEARIEYRDAAE